jgi:glycerate 2-kinase
VTRALLACGAVIDEVNCLRKHLSSIKGGHLARLLHPATSVNLILSDVVGDSLDTIASGPTTGDGTCFADVQAIVDKYDLSDRLPEPVRRVFQLGADGRIPDTPQPGDPVFDRVTNLLIGTNYLSLEAARDAARALGCTARILTSQVVGEAREVAKFYCAIGKDAVSHRLWGDPPLCLIAGGETTVTIAGEGRGGRNQEMALAFLGEMEHQPEACRDLYFLAASTDGNDGPTDAAGAFACRQLLERAQSRGVSIVDHLKRNDAYTFFASIDGLLKTGPTNTNVCDIQLLLIP